MISNRRCKKEKKKVKLSNQDYTVWFLLAMLVLISKTVFPNIRRGFSHISMQKKGWRNEGEFQ